MHKQYEQARKAVAAGLPEGPLKGVPYLIKDLGFFETGEPATFGSSLFKEFVADHETAYVTRCKKAGLVFMGRSSSPEFGLAGGEVRAAARRRPAPRWSAACG